MGRKKSALLVGEVNMKRLCLCISFLISSVIFPLSAAGNMEGLFDLTLEELLQVHVDTATVRPSPWIRQPATLTILTRSELKAFGAHTILDALELVPGISFGIYYRGFPGINFRGNWAGEGKILFLLDDIPMNAPLYGHVPALRRFLLEQIERIEVLRGTGAAKYGGNAQLAVIRVYSREYDRQGASFTVRHMEGTSTGHSNTVTVGEQSDQYKFSLSSNRSRSPFSGESWADVLGNTLDLEKTADYKNQNVIAKFDWLDFKLRFFYDDSKSNSPHGIGFFRDHELITFTNYNSLLSYDWNVNTHITLTPKIVYRRQEDWKIDFNATPGLEVDLPTTAQSYQLNAFLNFDQWTLLSGIEYWRNKATARNLIAEGFTASTYFDGSRSQIQKGKTLFSQAEWYYRDWTISAGIRYSNPNFVQSSTVPRLSVAYNEKNWHAKIHYGKAFREPEIDIINLADPETGRLLPEETTQKELEVGWALSSNWYSTFNFFRTDLDNTVFLDTTSVDENSFFFTNNDRVGTQGVENEVRGQWGGR